MGGDRITFEVFGPIAASDLGRWREGGREGGGGRRHEEAVPAIMGEGGRKGGGQGGAGYPNIQYY